ncbi:MAG: septation protein IspZ [Candidatus Moraniibacteriota bacterium]
MLNKKLLLNTLCEFGPILGFLVAFELGDFTTGVIAMMIATLISLIALKHFEKHTPIFALLSSGSVLLFGGTSLFIHIPSIFILRDTLFDSVFGLALIISVWKGNPLFKYIFSGVFAITDRGWNILSLRWGIFFIILAVLNEWVRLTLSPEDWVIAKIFIILASVAFGSYQITLTKKERLPHATARGLVA